MLFSPLFGDGFRFGGGDFRHRRAAYIYIRGKTEGMKIYVIRMPKIFRPLFRKWAKRGNTRRRN